MNPYEINKMLDSDFDDFDDDDDSDKDPDYNICKYLLMFFYKQYIKIFCILNNLIIFKNY